MRRSSDIAAVVTGGASGLGRATVEKLRADGVKVAIFDRGRSARAAVLAMNGVSIELGLEGTLALQPLARIDEPGEMAFALEWITGLLTNEGLKVTPDIKDAVWTALKSLASAPKSVFARRRVEHVADLTGKG